MKAYVFPGQGAQFVGMGKDLYDNNPKAKALFDEADQILGYKITDVMFAGTDEELKQTKVTQPAVFLHSVISAICKGDEYEMVAGHSLGEFSALVAAKALSFADGLKLVYARAMAMQKACEKAPSTMAAIIGLSDKVVEDICKEVSSEGNVVVPANFNCPGQLVISGNIEAVNAACEKLKAAGAKRALVLKVGGAFHSPLMEPARAELAAAIEKTEEIMGIWDYLVYKEHTHYYENNQIDSDLNILLVGDSFIRMFLKDDIAEGFSETLSIDWMNLPILDKIVQDFQPDIVVLESTESTLGTVMEYLDRMEFVK